MDASELIIDYIRTNRVSTTEVADCLGKSGAFKGIYPINPGLHKVGEVFYVYGFSNSNYSIHEQIRNIPEGCIVVIDGIDVNDRALIGELVTKYLTLYNHAEAVVVNGLVRDVNCLIKNNYPIWSKGRTPVGCFNEKIEMTEKVKAIVNERKEEFNKSICVCDDTGVVIIERKDINNSLLEKLYSIEEQEDTWFYCLDRNKWDTFDIVCEKRYLREKQ